MTVLHHALLAQANAVLVGEICFNVKREQNKFRLLNAMLSMMKAKKYKGKTIKQWANLLEMTPAAIRYRLRMGIALDAPRGKIYHGMRDHPAYKLWASMKNRCYNKNEPAYPRYGGRGIEVCKRWHTFTNFYEDMWPRPEGHTLERTNNNGNYSPGNCTWADRTAQANNRSSNTKITYKGQTLTIAQWSRKRPLSQFVIASRLRHGWSVEDALDTPLMRQGKKDE